MIYWFLIALALVLLAFGQWFPAFIAAFGAMLVVVLGR